MRIIKLEIHHIMLALIALFSIGFMDMTGIFLLLMLVMLFLFAGHRIEIDRLTVVLFFFSVLYFAPIAISDNLSLDKVIKFLLAPWGCYIIGRTVIISNKKLTVTRVAFVLVTGFFLRGMLNYAMSVATYGISFDSTFRLAIDFWQNRVISVTSAALYYSPMALTAMAMLFLSKGKQRWFAAAAIALSLLACFQYQNRTLPVALLILLVFLFIQFLKRHDIGDDRKILIFFLLIVCGLLCVVIWTADVSNIRSLISGTRLYERFFNSSSSRTDIWLSFLTQAWKYPFGGRQADLLDGHGYVHNLWLDVYYSSGVLPFIMLVLFTFQAYKLCRIFLKKGYQDEQSWVIVWCLVGITIVSAVEPILEANPYYFYIPLFMLGGISGKMRSVPTPTVHDIT